jgi:hypothetical protein
VSGAKRRLRELDDRVNQLRMGRLEFEHEERTDALKQVSVAQDDPEPLRRENARLRKENEVLKSGHLLRMRVGL